MKEQAKCPTMEAFAALGDEALAESGMRSMLQTVISLSKVSDEVAVHAIMFAMQGLLASYTALIVDYMYGKGASDKLIDDYMDRGLERMLGSE